MKSRKIEKHPLLSKPRGFKLQRMFQMVALAVVQQNYYNPQCHFFQALLQYAQVDLFPFNHFLKSFLHFCGGIRALPDMVRVAVGTHARCLLRHDAVILHAFGL